MVTLLEALRLSFDRRTARVTVTASDSSGSVMFKLKVTGI